MTIKTPYKSEVIEEIKIDTSVIDGKVDIVDTSLDTLLSRLTASRANYLDNINNSNLATLPAISSARIGYLDNINNPQLLNISSTILGRIDASISSRSSHSASDIWSVTTRALTDKANFSLSTTGIDAIRKSVCLTGDTASSIGKILFDLNARLTSTRAGYLDNLSGGAVALNSTVAKEATLTHATYGLDKIKTETASLVSKVDTIDSIVDLIKIETDKIANATYGLSALNTDLDTLISNLGTVDTVVDAIKAKTDLLFSGIATEDKQNTIIGYIDTEIGAIKAKTDLIGASVAPADEYDTEMARITGNVALEATLTAIKGSGWTTETLKAIYDSIDGLNDITAASVWAVGTRALTDKANFTLASSEYANVRLSVCATGDTANSIGKILYDFSNVRLSATRCGYIDLLVNATYGLNAIKTAVNAIPTTAMRGTDNAALASVWTSTRAGYIDYLASGTYGLSALKTLIDTVDSVADAIKLKTDLLFAVSSSSVSHDITTANDTVETVIEEIEDTNNYSLSLFFDLDTLKSASEGEVVTIKLYNKIDGSNYSDSPIAVSEYVVGSEIEYPSIETNVLSGYSKITISCSGEVTATRSIVCRILKRNM